MFKITKSLFIRFNPIWTKIRLINQIKIHKIIKIIKNIQLKYLKNITKNNTFLRINIKN